MKGIKEKNVKKIVLWFDYKKYEKKLNIIKIKILYILKLLNFLYNEWK